MTLRFTSFSVLVCFDLKNLDRIMDLIITPNFSIVTKESSLDTVFEPLSGFEPCQSVWVFSLILVAENLRVPLRGALPNSLTERVSDIKWCKLQKKVV